MNELVSILIPVYNRGNLIEETVQSALNQTYKNIEIIIVDNKSTDNTWEILQRLASQDKRIRIFQNETNIGPVRNWKRCIDEANGVYGKILWSDDLMAPDFIEKTVDIFANKENLGFIFSGVEIFDELNHRKDAFFIGESGIYPSEKYIEGLLIKTNYPVSASCALFRLKDLKKNLMLQVPNKIGSNFSMHGIGPDALMFLLTAKDYKYFAFVNEKLTFFRAHAGSITRSSNSCKLTINYDIVKAYFVENFVLDKNLRKKFNALLVLHYLNCRKHLEGIKSLNDFYMSKSIGILDVNFTTIVGYIMKKISQRKNINE